MLAERPLRPPVGRHAAVRWRNAYVRGGSNLRARPPEDRGEPCIGNAEPVRALAPDRHELLVRGRQILVGPGSSRCDARSTRTGTAGLGERRLDLGRAAGEGTADARVNAGEVGPSAGQLAPRDTEPARELGAQLRLVKGTRCLQLEEEAAGIQGGPEAVRAGGQVRDENVAVEVGIGSAARAVHERGGDKAPGRDGRLGPAVSERAPDPRAASFQVPERSGGRFLVAGPHLRPNLLGSERMQHAHRFWGGVGAVVGSYTHSVVVRGQHLAGDGVDASEQCAQRAAVYVPGEAERCSRSPEPATLGLDERAGAGRTRVLAAGGHRREVVALPPPGHLRNAQHRPWIRPVPTDRPTGASPAGRAKAGRR